MYNLQAIQTCQYGSTELDAHTLENEDCSRSKFYAYYKTSLQTACYAKWCTTINDMLLLNFTL